MSLLLAWGCTLAGGSSQAREPWLPHVAWACSVALGSVHARPHFGRCGMFVLGCPEGPGCNQLRALVSLPAPLNTGLHWACFPCDACSQPCLPVLDESDAAPIFNQERDTSKLHVPTPGACSLLLASVRHSHDHLHHSLSISLYISLFLHEWA